MFGERAAKTVKEKKRVGGGNFKRSYGLGNRFPHSEKNKSRLSEINSLKARLLQWQLFKIAKTRLSEMELALCEIDPVFSKFCFSLA